MYTYFYSMVIIDKDKLHPKTLHKAYLLLIFIGYGISILIPLNLCIAYYMSPNDASLFYPFTLVKEYWYHSVHLALQCWWLQDGPCLLWASRCKWSIFQRKVQNCPLTFTKLALTMKHIFYSTTCIINFEENMLILQFCNHQNLKAVSFFRV